MHGARRAERLIAAVPLVARDRRGRSDRDLASLRRHPRSDARIQSGEFLQLAARERITHTVLVPAMYNLCLLDPELDHQDLSAWRIGGFGGAPMPLTTIEQWASRLPALRLMNLYGATETTSPATIMPAQFTASHADSVGLAWHAGTSSGSMRRS